MTDLDRPGSSSRYTWTDDDDTEVPADDGAAPEELVEDDLITNEHDLNVEVAALEEEELRERVRREQLDAQASGVARSLAWDDDEVTDVPAESWETDEDGESTDDEDDGNVDDATETTVDDRGEEADAAAELTLETLTPADAEAIREAMRGEADGSELDPAARRRAEIRAAAEASERVPTWRQDDGSGPAELLPESGVVYVFEPNTKAVPPVREYLAGLWARRKFMVELARSESRGSRSSTVLGELWAVLDPMFQVGLYWFLLSIIRGGKGRAGHTLSQTLVLMVGGIFLFTLSSTTITAGGRSILAAKNLMLNSTFPRALLPLSAAYKGVTEFIPTIFIYLIFHFAFGQKFGLGFFVLPLLFVVQMVMSIGLGLIFATFTVFLRDTTNLLGYIMRVLFFATPVIYPASSVPDGLRTVLQINPFFALFCSYQAIISGGAPKPVDIVVSSAWATLFIIVGYRLFTANERSFALRL